MTGENVCATLRLNMHYLMLDEDKQNHTFGACC